MYLGGVDEEKAGFKERGCPGLPTHSVLSVQVGVKHAIEDIEEAEAEAIAGIGIEVSYIFIVLSSERRRRNTNEQDAYFTGWIWDFTSG
jgi:hypothetical protein